MNFEYIIFGCGFAIVVIGFWMLNKSIANIEEEYLKDERFEVILSKIQGIEKVLNEKRESPVEVKPAQKPMQKKKEEKIDDFFFEEIDEDDNLERMAKHGYSKEEIGKKMGKSIREVDLMMKMKKGGRI